MMQQYFFLREVEFGNDGDYSEDRFINIVNAHLANTVGNLLNRTLGLLKKNCQSTLAVDSTIAAEGNAFKDTVEKLTNVFYVLNEKISEVRRLQMELNRRDNIEADDTAEGLKRVIATLEKENNSLKMAKVELETSLKAANENSNKQSTSLSEEIEESEKMDEDSKIIEELKEKNEYQRLQILHLEKALKQAITGQEEVKMINNNELQKYKEIIDDLNRKLTSCMSTIDAKNVELLNLQIALGSYYAELEAKDAHQKAEISRKEKEDILENLSQFERIPTEGRNRVNKLEEDNAKLRRALEQSMSRL
ncbi:Golgin candidate 3 [Camellia lanceoleosa]|uniref:Golgin candidate 3 n=1 Tax=Camellia lanceoleosa TaxID=1840588 RepID=A0ACC0IAG6_9ERIC|nr:Golgin candidate 3 [Camellia lanceoleosa]